MIGMYITPPPTPTPTPCSKISCQTYKNAVSISKDAVKRVPHTRVAKLDANKDTKQTNSPHHMDIRT